MANMQTAMRRPMVADDSKSFWVIFVLSYPVLLAIALTGQLLGWHWRDWLPGAEGVTSVFGGVKAAVYTFMSHLL
jgi:light-harvesting complex 1 beta chain